MDNGYTEKSLSIILAKETEWHTDIAGTEAIHKIGNYLAHFFPILSAIEFTMQVIRPTLPKHQLE